MIDLIRNSNSISMDELEILILDEADRLLDLGFQDEVEELVKLCPRGRQV
jgi:ATP-dependent RNA helicase DDX27